MQNDVPTSLGWLNTVYTFLAGSVGGGLFIRLLDRWLNRKKHVAEVEKTEAETRRIHIESDIEISQFVARSTVRLERMQERIDAVNLELAQRDTELKLAQNDVRKLKALCDLHGIKFSEFDERKDSKGNLT